MRNMNRKYYQLPMDGPYDDNEQKFIGRGHGFTMRMLNFISRLGVRKHWTKIDGHYAVDQYMAYQYSQRMYIKHCREVKL